jgi:hypothetical protein
MYVGVYCNGKLHSRSKNINNAIMKAIDLLNINYECVKDDIFFDNEMYIKALNNVTKGSDVSFFNLKISFKEIEEKKYSVTYTRTLEDCEETMGLPYCSRQEKIVCLENDVKEHFLLLKSKLDNAVEGNGKMCDMLENGYVEVLQDTNLVYEVYVKPTHEFHIVEIKELD